MSLFACVTVVLAILYWAHNYFSRSEGPQPVFIPEKIPFVSHALGIGRHGAMYYRGISERTRLPIFALRLFTKTIYVVQDASLIARIQRHPTISFDPFVLLAAERLCGASPAMLQTMRREMKDGKKTRSSLMNESHVLTHTIFRSQSNLSELVSKILSIVSHELERTSTADLFQWVRHTVCLASTDAVYGPQNPFRVHAKLEDAFWDYDADLSLLLLNLFPSVTARKGHKAKKALREAFIRYFRDGGSDQASTFVRACHEANQKRGISHEDQAGFEVVHCIGLLVNTPPTLFWMIYHIYSDPQLLEKLRTELINCVYTSASFHRTLDMQQVINDAPLLHSTLNEVLRLHASSLSTRIVLSDTSLGADTLLKKGAIVHMPSACLHNDPAYFGPRTESFDAERFLLGKMPLKGTASGAGVAFRPFGGGATLCPGRHFATRQVLCITAMLVLGYDIKVEGEGEWRWPGVAESTMTTTVLPPVEKVRVRFERRREFAVETLRFKI